MLPDCLFSFPYSILYQVYPENFQVCPAEAFNPILQLSIEQNSLDLSCEIKKTLGFHLRIATAPWVPSSSTSRWGCSYHQLVGIGNDDVDNHTPIFFILAAIDKDFLLWVAEMALRLFKLFPSVCVFHFRYWKRGLRLDENYLRLSTSFHGVLTVSRGMRVQKTTSVSSLTRPNCLPPKIFFSLPIGVRVFRPLVLSRLYAR